MHYKGKQSKLKTALVFSGGGSKGAFEVGVAKVLLKKIIPDVIIGTSIGSINGALIALDTPIKQMEKMWKKVTKKDIFPFNKKILYKLHFAESIYSNKRLQKLP